MRALKANKNVLLQYHSQKTRLSTHQFCRIFDVFIIIWTFAEFYSQIFGFSTDLKLLFQEIFKLSPNLEFF